MDLFLQSSSSRFHFHTSSINSSSSSSSSRNLSRFLFTIRSSLPIPLQKAKYNKELQAAVNVVEKACRLCVDVKKSLFSSEGKILEKNDQTPVTVADFGVQALISLELNRLFPSIPLVAEEDSAFLRSSILVDTVVSVVNDTMETGDTTLDRNDVLKAIDRGGKDAFIFGENPATYWVLDPIDGTRGFLKGTEALYVVGLALVIDGEIAVGVMGCPNWQADISKNLGTEDQEDKSGQPGQGILMVAHVGCGTWTKRLSNLLGSNTAGHIDWTRCYVDSCRIIHEARFCIPESITWESLPLSRCLTSTTNADSVDNGQVLLLPTCCGSLCKYIMVASGRASVFIQRSRAKTVVKAWDHAVGVICVIEAGGQVFSSCFVNP
ncbi:hypothetical protein AQUCO_03800197v1 [Aquilegia coerulea]|uniref:3'(2'),5'-bisphosphate nucleotidase n=1 Tax=Aquilegia coerulea TaxID=218851 RepID=A0A2G5CT01_AQUCA|nr:hypothetical protein AQUCO_03800197v1 [Aquilegia coerulea]